jgi:two-component system, LytTR family, response regulator
VDARTVYSYASATVAGFSMTLGSLVVDDERLARALDKLDAGDSETQARVRPLRYDDCLFLMIGNRYRFLKIGAIIAIHAAGDYSQIFLDDGAKGLALKAMKEWEQRLPPQNFIRVHRSAIINMEHVERIEESFNYSLRVFLKGVAEPVVISRRYAVRLKEQLG